MRIRELPGAIVPPHSHPVDEHITVVEGTWYFALGDEFKPEALQELKVGSYAFAPMGSSMVYGLATLRHPYFQQTFERMGWQLIGIMNPDHSARRPRVAIRAD